MTYFAIRLGITASLLFMYSPATGLSQTTSSRDNGASKGLAQVYPEAQRVLIILHDIGQKGTNMAGRARTALSTGDFDHVFAPTYDWKNTTIPEAAPLLFTELNRRFPNAEFVLDGYGKGGLVARWITERVPEAEGRIERIITTSSPNNGANVSRLAKTVHLKITDTFPAGLAELAPGSSTLQSFKESPFNDLNTVDAIQTYEKWQSDITQDSGLDGLPDSYGSDKRVILVAPDPDLKDRIYNGNPSFTPKSATEDLHSIPEHTIDLNPTIVHQTNKGTRHNQSDQNINSSPVESRNIDGIKRLIKDNEDSLSTTREEISKDSARTAIEAILDALGLGSAVRLEHAGEYANKMMDALLNGHYLDALENGGRAADEFLGAILDEGTKLGIPSAALLNLAREMSTKGVDTIFKVLHYRELKQQKQQLENDLKRAEDQQNRQKMTLYTRLLNGNIPPEASQNPIELSDQVGKDASEVPLGWIVCQCPGDHPGLGIIVKGVQYHSTGFTCPQ